MEIAQPPDSRREELIPVVSYAVRRLIEPGQPDYWDYATRLELAVLARDQQAASDALSDALANKREHWEPESTARNLRLIAGPGLLGILGHLLAYSVYNPTLEVLRDRLGFLSTHALRP
jgi:hypothetical protein